MPWMDSVTAVSSNILQDIINFDFTSDVGAYYEASPDMPLQLLLFFNVFTFPFWLLTSGLFLYIKCLGNLSRFLSVAVVLMFSAIECLRLYLGYIGNLSQQIPELAGFWMLSVLLQLPLLTFQLTNPYLHPHPIEVTLHGVLWVLLIFQLWTGFVALQAASSRAKQYYAMKSKAKPKSGNAE